MFHDSYKKTISTIDHENFESIKLFLVSIKFTSILIMKKKNKIVVGTVCIQE